jgi:hypothetical protein
MTVLKRILEYVWLALFFICILGGINQTYRQGISKSYLFFVCAILAFGFYWIRKNRRINNTNDQ